MIALTHPIKQMINSQHGFLSSMLERFPNLLDEWIEKQKKDVEELASEYAEGDAEVYRDTYNSEMKRIDPCYGEELLFNQAMLIMVYSYYEATLLRLSKESHVHSLRPIIIANKFNAFLDDELIRISDFIYNKVEPLRDQLCHNNSGTLFEKNKERAEACINYLSQKKYISVDEGRITFIDRAFIKKVLDGEHRLLLYLAEICGFKTQWCLHKDGKMVRYDSYEEFKKQRGEL